MVFYTYIYAEIRTYPGLHKPGWARVISLGGASLNEFYNPRPCSILYPFLELAKLNSHAVRPQHKVALTRN
ncbi:hypothetical protein TSAR_014406 [Trichomalopsis sarcophagae]|uniref:Uncharacterized protein n=1 Tax=Trichomalopsis sarcophagae TaxID=543379 RepID=A0A232EG65_9HYME|nr:hypothetical protein TSAR_014406 [Trichomalopsis sarcophagae]